MSVEGTELGPFRNVQSEIVVASCPYTLGEETDTHAHRHRGIGIQQHFAIDALSTADFGKASVMRPAGLNAVRPS